jgi:glutamate racemase
VTSSKTYSATTNPPIGFLDSGIGGLPYLDRARELLPHERFVYLADREHFPYGTRTRDEIRSIVIGAVTTLVNAAHPKLFVVACNTASVVSLAELRATFSLPFVGVVPAIKPAGEAVHGGKIGVLATERTVEDPYLTNLQREFAPDSRLVQVPAGELVQIIESRLAVASKEEILSVLQPAADLLLAESVDTVVLGCTHFVHIGNELRELLARAVPVLDSVDGVARQVARVCGQDGETPVDPPLITPSGRTDLAQDILLVTGGEPGENYRQLAARYNLRLVVNGFGEQVE